MERSSYMRGWHIMMALLLALLPCAARSQVVEYIHSDSLGSRVAITNEAGQVIERTDYAPYGGVLGKPNSDRPGYTGHVMDSATGLVYMQQRYYDPSIGRFLSTDPVQADANTGYLFNRYSYANNNPYRFTDPDGRQSVQEQIDSGAQGCGRITCAGWATLSATWKVLGAEGISQLADKGWGATSGGDRAGAGLEVLAAVPVLKPLRLAESVVRGGAEAVRIGQAGERAVKAVVDIGEKARISINGNIRIPDGMTSTTLSEVKNVASLSYTSQLRDFADFAKQTGRQFDLYMRPDTKLSAPLQEAIRSGDIRPCIIGKAC